MGCKSALFTDQLPLFIFDDHGSGPQLFTLIGSQFFKTPAFPGLDRTTGKLLFIVHKNTNKPALQKANIR
jgi:hypothetical protein